MFKNLLNTFDEAVGSVATAVTEAGSALVGDSNNPVQIVEALKPAVLKQEPPEKQVERYEKALAAAQVEESRNAMAEAGILSSLGSTLSDLSHAKGMKLNDIAEKALLDLITVYASLPEFGEALGVANDGCNGVLNLIRKYMREIGSTTKKTKLDSFFKTQLSWVGVLKCLAQHDACAASIGAINGVRMLLEIWGGLEDKELLKTAAHRAEFPEIIISVCRLDDNLLQFGSRRGQLTQWLSR
jgi:hypothetical protein